MTTPSGAPAQAQSGQAHAQGSSAAQPPAPAAYPFPVGFYDNETQDGGQFSLLQTAAPQQFPIYNVTPTGWVRGLWFDFLMVVTANSGNTVTYAKDNPVSSINKVILRDLGQQAIIGPIGGYDWLTLNKFGAYQNIADPRAELTYQAVAGPGPTAGSFQFSLYLPFELVQRDALGVAENKSKPGWTVELWLDSQANTYNQVPSVFGTMNVVAFPVSYATAVGASPAGRMFSAAPPQPGTLQYWRTENGAVPASSANYDLVNGIGFPIRNLIYKLLDTASGTRLGGDAAFPSPVTLQYGQIIMFAKTARRWISEMGRPFGLTNPVPDSALGREYGVYVWWRTQDFDMQPGAELRQRYLNTATNTLVRLTGTFAAAGSLNVLCNWVAPVNKNYYTIVQG
jgi:hypothetical protein